MNCSIFLINTIRALKKIIICRKLAIIVNIKLSIAYSKKIPKNFIWEFRIQKLVQDIRFRKIAIQNYIKVCLPEHLMKVRFQLL